MRQQSGKREERTQRVQGLPSLEGRIFCLALMLLPCAMLVAGCKPTSLTPQNDRGGESPSQVSATPSPLPPRRDKIWLDFDGEKTLINAKTIADFGPRPAGGDANAKTRQYLNDQLIQLGWQTSEQRFTENSPDGKKIEFCNLTARFTHFPASSQRFIIGSHFDTVTSEAYQSVSASDGAAGSAILLELARILSSDPQLAGCIELLFLDGNAPFRQINANDGLFGSRFYTEMLRLNQRPADVRGSLILENVGNSQFRLNFPPNSDKSLAGEIKSAAQYLAIKVDVANRPLMGDQYPFQQAGIRAIALLEADEPQLNTADDTPGRLGADSLVRVGRLILYFLAKQPLTP